MSGTGLKKWKPATRSGRLHAPAIAVSDQAVRGDDRLQGGEQLALGLQVLDHRLDDDRAGGDRGERIGDHELVLGPPALVGADPPLFAKALELRGDGVLRLARRPGTAVVEEGADARLDGDLGDASSHDARADHGEAQVLPGNVEGHGP
jgi:hypothetical protein